MKHPVQKVVALFIVSSILIGGLYLWKQPAVNRSSITKEGTKSERDNGEYIDRDNEGRQEYYFKMLRDPATNRIPANARARELAYAKKLLENEHIRNQKFSNPTVASVSNSFDWSQAGPYNVGGRTRALAIDVANSNHIIAGGVSGGIWESKDNGKTWSLRNLPSQNLSVSYVVQDPRAGHTSTWYYSSGEFIGNTASGMGNSAPYRGTGIYKSTNNGDSWTILSSTQASNYTTYNNPYQYVSKIVVSPTTGSIFIASYNFGILKSTDGGASFNQILGKVNDHVWTGLAINKNGDVLASLSAQGFNKPASTKSGFYYSTDDGSTWKNFTPAGFPSYYERTVMAFAPSKPSVAYALTYNGTTTSDQSKVSFYQFTFKGDSLYSAADRSSNIPNYGGKVGQFNVQNNYNMLVSVKPDDYQFVLIGATNLFRSGNGFATSPTQDFGWVGGYSTANNIHMYPGQHPDQHMAVFDPQNPTHVWTGHDGGLSYTTDITATSTSGNPVVWTDMNHGYLVSQFYTIALNKTANDDRVLGGAQDNGSPFFKLTGTLSSNVSQDVSSGDGGYAYLGSTYGYTETQNGTVTRHGYSSSGSITQFTPVQDVTPANAGNQLFVTPYAIDPGSENVMYYLAGDSLWRNTKVDGSSPGSNWKLLSNIKGPSGYQFTSLKVSHSPAHILYLGASNTQSGSTTNQPYVYRVNNSDTATTALNRSSSNFPKGGYISDIAVNPNNANDILVIFSNYNVPSIFHSSDGGQTYASVGGNLDNLSSVGSTSFGPSVRTATILPTNSAGTFYLVGTSTGLYITQSLNGSSTQWSKQANSLIGNAVVERLTSRTSDNRIGVASHGRGIFIGKPSSTLPIAKPVQQPSNFKLAQNYPNPFNPSTNISYTLPVSSKVTLTVYDIMGRKVAQLISDAIQGSGNHVLTFKADNLASGTYFYRLEAVPQSGNAGQFTQTRKMILLK